MKKNYDVSEEVTNIITWYSKFHYKTTGNILEDFKTILKDIYFTEDWREVDVARILIDKFSELIQDNFKEIVGRSIFNSSCYFFNNDKLDSKLEFIRSIKSIIGNTEVKYLKGLDEEYKNKFNLGE